MKLRPAKTPLPRFSSDNEAAEYFEVHSLAKAWDQMTDVPPGKLSADLEKSIRRRHYQKLPVDRAPTGR
jgi:hypothetical protein